MASTIITKNGTSGAPSSLTAGELAINTTDGGIYYGSTGGTSVSSSFKFGAVTASVVSASGNVEGGSLRADDLTAGRVAFVGTDGLLVDDSDLTFATATLTATNIAAFTLSGKLTAGDSEIEGSNFDITGGSIGGETNVDASGGELTTTTAQNLAIIQGANANVDIGTFSLTANTLISDVADGTAPLTITSRTLVSNLNADKLDGADLIDEDNMASDSATRIPTQQSVKAYADTMLPLAGGTMTGAVNFGDQDITNVDSLDADKLSIAGGTEMTAVNDEDNMASNSATALATQQSIKAYADTKVSSAAQKQLTHHSYKADQGTTKTYIGLMDADSEETTTSQKLELPIIAPANGKLLKIFLRSNKNIQSHSLTWRLETIAAANFSATPNIIGTQTGDGCQNSAMTTYDFTGVTSNAVSAGNAVYISLESDTDFGNVVSYFITCMWEWDLS